MKKFLALMLLMVGSLQGIDVVYTWVDGSDVLWQTLRDFKTKERKTYRVAHGSLDKSRFRNNNELRYSLRSIQAFAPWVHHIYIVTCGQKPTWLAQHPKVSIVDHKTIFKRASDLPTFNSMAIECNLHHIPGLQENYIYFNDDVFLGRPVTPKDFYSSKGKKMHVFFSDNPFFSGPVEDTDVGYVAGVKNTSALLTREFGRKTRYTHAHSPFPLKRSLVYALEKKYAKIFSQVSSHHFRSLDDYTITNGLIPYVALYTKNAKVQPNCCRTVSYGKEVDSSRRRLESLWRKKPKFFCIQDNVDEGNKKVVRELKEFFEKYYPKRAPWEKKDK